MLVFPLRVVTRIDKREYPAHVPLAGNCLTSKGEFSSLRNSSFAMLLLFLSLQRLVAVGRVSLPPICCEIGTSSLEASSFIAMAPGD